jgi:Na+/H+ antiporter NhaD/arsenite permease-like protein
MVIAEFLVSLTIALLLTGLYMLVTRGDRRRTGLIWLFLIIFLATWAGGTWLRPFGPGLWGVNWLAFLLVGLVIVLVLFIVIPRKVPQGRRETLDMLDRIEQEKELEQVTYVTLSIFLWVLLFLLVMAIILRYIVGVELP